MHRETRLLMGMPITVAIVDDAPDALTGEVFAYFSAVDQRFSLYRDDSEITALNAGRITLAQASPDMREVLALADKTKRQTHGYFDIRRADDTLDPSGIVKGWAVRNAAAFMAAGGARHYFVDAGGDIQTSGKNADGADWVIGIRNPFNDQQIIKALALQGRAMATSGTYARGQHIYNPHQLGRPIDDIVSLSVIAADVLEADRFATAAFAMGLDGIGFVEAMPDLEGYVVDAQGIATQTSGFGAYVVS